MLRSLPKLCLLLCLALVTGPVRAGGLANDADTVQPLAKGQHLPMATVFNADGRKITLSELIAGKPTILVFYRGGWCPFCNSHLAGLAEIELDLRKLGFQIIGITPEHPSKLTPTAQETRVRYRLVSDQGMEAAGAFGVAFRLSAEAGARFKENGIDLPPAPDGQGFWQPVPAAFIISREGEIRFVYHDADAANAINPHDLLAAAKVIAK